ncbi:MAG: helix-turn-helix domain-containing protein [Candidatus Neomarinimicrobiota bacterium]
MTDKETAVLSAMQKAGKPVKAGDVAQTTGLPKDEVARIIAALKKQGKVESPKACFYIPVKS